MHAVVVAVDGVVATVPVPGVGNGSANTLLLSTPNTQQATESRVKNLLAAVRDFASIVDLLDRVVNPPSRST